MGRPVVQREPLKRANFLPDLENDSMQTFVVLFYLWLSVQIINDYSRYSVVEIFKRVSANAKIPLLGKVISMFGIPKVVKTSNGSPFNSKQFARYAEHIEFEHRKISPHWLRVHRQMPSISSKTEKTSYHRIKRTGNKRCRSFFVNIGQSLTQQLV